MLDLFRKFMPEWNWHWQEWDERKLAISRTVTQILPVNTGTSHHCYILITIEPRGAIFFPAHPHSSTIFLFQPMACRNCSSEADTLVIPPTHIFRVHVMKKMTDESRWEIRLPNHWLVCSEHGGSPRSRKRHGINAKKKTNVLQAHPSIWKLPMLNFITGRNLGRSR